MYKVSPPYSVYHGYLTNRKQARRATWIATLIVAFGMIATPAQAQLLDRLRGLGGGSVHQIL